MAPTLRGTLTAMAFLSPTGTEPTPVGTPYPDREPVRFYNTAAIVLGNATAGLLVAFVSMTSMQAAAVAAFANAVAVFVSTMVARGKVAPFVDILDTTPPDHSATEPDDTDLEVDQDVLRTLIEGGDLNDIDRPSEA